MSEEGAAWQGEGARYGRPLVMKGEVGSVSDTVMCERSEGYSLSVPVGGQSTARPDELQA